jgi:hypothetical protein
MISKTRQIELIAVAGFLLFGVGMIWFVDCVFSTSLSGCGLPLLLVAVGTSVGVGALAQRFLLVLT